MSWDQRHEGITIWSVQPSEKVPQERRSQCLLHEANEDRASLSERRQALAVNSGIALPTGRADTKAMVDTFTGFIMKFFGSTSPLFLKLTQVSDALDNPSAFGSYTPLMFAAVLWRLHWSLRMYFGMDRMNPANTMYIERLAFMLQMQEAIPTHDLPPQLQARSLPPIPAGGWPIAPLPVPQRSSVPAPSPAPAAPPPLPAQNTYPFASHFATKWARALAINPQARISNLFDTRLATKPFPKYADILGPAFLSKAPTGQDLCGRFHLTGECPAGSTCPHAHTLSSEPARGDINGALSRFDEAITHWIQNQALLSKNKRKNG